MFVDHSFFAIIFPELSLIVLATWIIVGSSFQRGRVWWTSFAVMSYVVALIALAQQDMHLFAMFGAGEGQLNGPLAVDLLGHGLRWLAVIMGLLFALNYGQPDRSQLTGERQGLLMLLVVGVMLVGSANELVLLFLGLELISVPTYVLLFLGRNDRSTAEATIKYFFLSIFSSAMLLYGFSFLYGIGGSTNLSDIHAALGRESTGMGILGLAPVAAVLIVAGLGYKIAAVPFHFYAPDVYQGSTNTNAGLLAVAPKIAGIAALARLAVYVMPESFAFGWPLILVLSMISMTIGNVCALWQTNLRRMMAYSSIAHAGYMLIGLSVALAAAETGDLTSGGVAAMLVYLTMYVFATIGVFSALSYLSGPDHEISEVDELAGVGRSHSTAGTVIAMGMFSLAGIPPLAGFWGKFAVFGSAIRFAAMPTSGAASWWFIVLAIVGAVNAAIAAVYYLNVVSTLYFRTSQTSTPARGGYGSLAAMSISAIAIGFLGLVPGGVMKTAGLAEQTALSVSEQQLPIGPVHTAQADAEQPVEPHSIAGE
ncbi:NADH-quinone oxidoreductase subunit N [Lignipirellula cremea]|uniref:NADH-quinone oxidoreductase subunit N n=1 Tax=Lignipirellula cremea TaxID=2528010 RepID=A0A518DQV1_9BACT|nr:NADH-quinone oxidoreductase subunit N [Lignipirellula cremea]QDU94217.1 NADH-quinone oxidoreductase subunit N [Lignipirellula cremea]